ncbi:hypothetical protein OQZ33_14430 [Pedobacter sp. MC2016-05]|uniref:hypothetical protein n=1 Tax=Pedobacter sp. MC2016-05 TaxID=2994474 RepID=UPI002245969F|nr:hypothetical protein [Pedobacter sp. MC2016-05]MCX2475526.1 hypothetical protein [Pedobacter sp. MC2016-05]
MLKLQKRGAITFDYGNILRGRALEVGVENAFVFPGFVPAYILPLFCEGKSPFRWAALSGDLQDIYETGQLIFNYSQKMKVYIAGLKWRKSGLLFKDQF